MQVNDLIHGFRVRGSETLSEIGATLWRMEYEKNERKLMICILSRRRES